MAQRVTTASSTPGAVTSTSYVISLPTGAKTAKLIGFTITRAGGGTVSAVSLTDSGGTTTYRNFQLATAAAFMNQDNISSPIPLIAGDLFTITHSNTAAAAITVTYDWEILT